MELLSFWKFIFKVMFVSLIKIAHCTTNAISIGKLNLDEIQRLPGLNNTTRFKQYSGYLNASEGNFLHYWFIKSQRAPTSDPLLLWFNGGPGCSSMEGLFEEIGPFKIRKDGKTLYENPYSWTKVASIVFLESPVGVGYSYSSKTKNYSTNDAMVLNDHYLALVHFFQKFPEFQKNDFYITGESYAGVYIPTLAVKVLAEKAKINLKGFAIGNGYLNRKMMYHSLMFFGYYHGLVGYFYWERITKDCCNGTATPKSCNFELEADTSDKCKQESLKSLNHHIHSKSLNIYNIYHKCHNISKQNSRYLIERSNFLQLSVLDEEILYGDSCLPQKHITTYMNLEAVREAIHIPRALPRWVECNDDLFKTYKKQLPDMKNHVLQLMKSGKIRGLFFNGDVDTACNFIGNEWFVRSLKLPKLKSHRPWHYKRNVAGYVVYYKNLIYLTVRGSGHMVPQDKPGPALQMITRFLRNKRL